MFGRVRLCRHGGEVSRLISGAVARGRRLQYGCTGADHNLLVRAHRPGHYHLRAGCELYGYVTWRASIVEDGGSAVSLDNEVVVSGQDGNVAGSVIDDIEVATVTASRQGGG